MKENECCNQDCNQGRDCPKRSERSLSQEITEGFKALEAMRNNEPVAWMEYIQDEEWEVWFVEPTDLPKGHTYKPLYTHPAKTLTDEEIMDCFKEVNLFTANMVDVARAILRKAQEK